MKIAILGAAGRMGQNLLRCAGKTDSCTVVAATERPDHPAIGASVKEVSGLRVEAVPDALRYTADWPEEAEGVIDFTFHTTVTDNLANAVANGQAYVLGTTGLTDDEKKAVCAAAKKIPVVWAPNMSLGVNLLLELVRRSAAILGPDYDAEIVEMHHRLKKDAPSGTALGLAEALAEGRGVNLKEVACYGREGMPGERPRGEIGIHALRGGSVVGDHTVMFVADEERIELTHRANSREAFATGALRAALWLKGRQPGLYNMRHVLGFEAV
jgi:4-hydroxy-tetrahydrodipicolinate reductase